MAKGEHVFTSEGRQTTKNNREPVPTGDYHVTLRSGGANVQKKEEPGSIPYIAGVYFALPADKDGNEKRVYHNFFVHAQPNDKGQVLVDKEDQAVGLAQALGATLTCPTMQVQRAIKDLKTKLPTGKMEDYTVLNPKPFKEWLQAHDGEELDVHIKLQPANPKKGFEARNVVERFIPKGAAGAFGDSDGGNEPNPFEPAGGNEEPEAPPAEEAPKKGKKGGKKKAAEASAEE